jgi:hypothetical protein
MLFILFMLGFQSFSQQQEFFVETADGTKVVITAAKIDGDRKKVIYKISGAERQTKAKYAAIKTVSYAGYVFRVFKIKNKYEGFYIMAETPEKTLGFRKFEKIANKGGGFESTFEHIDFAVFNNQGNLLERQDLRETNNAKNIQTRQLTAQAIQTHFADCQKVMERLAKYYLPEDNDKKDILYFFGQQENIINCN